MRKPTLIIAEAGVNHNGSLDLALKLCDVAKASGVDIIKFQTFKTEKVLTNDAPLAQYQENNIGREKNQFQMVKEFELSYDQFVSIKKYCDSIGLEFLSTPDDEDSLAFLVENLGLRLIKIGSGEITSIPFLRSIAKRQLPVILSTGMSTLGEVDTAVRELINYGASDITLLHCTTDYPCPLQDVNLRAMQTLRDAFKLPVGYSDHTEGIIISVAAVACGATIIEKHFTIDKKLPGPDHAASLDPKELAQMVKAIREVEAALGTGVKTPTQSEKMIQSVVRRSIVAARPIACGEMFTCENITIKRTGGNGLSASLWDFVIGRKAQKNYNTDELVEL